VKPTKFSVSFKLEIEYFNIPKQNRKSSLKILRTSL